MRCDPPGYPGGHPLASLNEPPGSDHRHSRHSPVRETTIWLRTSVQSEGSASFTWTTQSALRIAACGRNFRTEILATWKPTPCGPTPASVAIFRIAPGSASGTVDSSAPPGGRHCCQEEKHICIHAMRTFDLRGEVLYEVHSSSCLIPVQSGRADHHHSLHHARLVQPFQDADEDVRCPVNAKRLVEPLRFSQRIAKAPLALLDLLLRRSELRV